MLRSLASKTSDATSCHSPLRHQLRRISSSIPRFSPDVAESAPGDAIVRGRTKRTTINDSPANPTTKIQIMIRSYEPIQNLPWELPPNTREVNLPPSRTLYTVIRGPHVHKSSREQFESKIYKKVLVMNAERHELRKKFFWLKRQRIFGAQFEILFSYKTRLDKGILQRILRPEDSLNLKGVSETGNLEKGVFSKPAMEKSQEIAEDMQERFGTSDHHLDHKIQDFKDSRSTLNQIE